MGRQNLTPEVLLNAYAAGVFPMAESRDDPEVFWVDPRRRGIFPLDNFHISRSLRRRILKEEYSIRTNTDFAGVLRGCAERDETWINDIIFDLYTQLHRAGFAQSLEVWQDGALTGGVYGVTLGGAFFGESMFSRRTDASKIALAYLVDRLRQGGFSLFDTQFLTPHLKSLGAIEISRAEYHVLLNRALHQTADFNAPATPGAQLLVQRNTQTS
ncbi:MAG: leucyl/phenylalanyl-tRNA--protein transferase [Confluentimicrobium sp.]|mgnify:CR=1 FL=1|jgi:leucyl/phenylalanyl-tRNA---protein transferase|uniref:leucyl/phenylalanyl-tRNA--protein transferase n=1 Tax=Actibacterium sp. TaxID=1872125 RepID=UPI00050FF615|nr:leucyl/phenylalanyl-tRNA--protein transferase [Actibacterium sp.]KGB80494.1 leucyl/phenylalanyl-tRNA--protein transferase [Rhodovulum sp. NI22]MBC56017.1 leucyl/phenylalanyl-tRNA--protein transferase [Actibacterium sp.]MDY6858344.1 leucyl/phenylalanyl-tRNA--protein transferase [Pseudomonadota bacterium]|tara:strand:+ start:1665 stop:2306 length:642 start_codon:yes stop_codon:yes gene_type:complete